MSDTAPTRIAILGGGCGAISAAFWLTDDPARRAAVDVTVYVQGWRLGGKGASGRNAAHHDRIEEHGLHLFLGFYETAFTTMRRTYDALHGSGHALFDGWKAAFSPQREVTLWIAPDSGGSGAWQPYTAGFPQLPGEPGDPHPSFLDEVPQLILEALEGRLFPRLVAIGDAHDIEIVLPGHEPARGLLDRLRQALSPEDFATHHRSLLGEIEGLIEHARAEMKAKLAHIGAEEHILFVLVELGYVLMRGYVADILPYGQPGFARIDEQDFQAWLRSHGASAEVAWSEPIRSLYDLGFAFRDGDSTDPTKAAMAAGAALHCLLRMALGYRDAPLWRMNAGMGDTIFAPLYLLLRERGVRFAFFHRIQGLAMEPGGTQVASILLSRQVDLSGGSYDPLRQVGEILCWPSEPFWKQILDGDRLERDGVDLESPWCIHEVGRTTLERGRDFDALVLAIPPAASAPLTRTLASAQPAWQAMLDSQVSVATHSVQLWLKRDLRGLGWSEGDEAPVATTYVTPLESWADMSHLLVRESWGEDGPKSCQYLCGVVPMPRVLPQPSRAGDRFQAEQNAAGERVTVSWAKEAGSGMWPNIVGPAGIDPDAVVDVYDHVNVAPTEQYVLTLPGSTKFRLAPGWDAVQNLALAGDWTFTSINGGSAEAAFESGRSAAQALAERFLAVPVA